MYSESAVSSWGGFEVDKENDKNVDTNLFFHIYTQSATTVGIVKECPDDVVCLGAYVILGANGFTHSSRTVKKVCETFLDASSEFEALLSMYTVLEAIFN